MGLAEIVAPERKIQLRVCYPDSKQTCDVLLGQPTEWAIEIKTFRPNGDNGKPDDTAIKDILSPFASDRVELDLSGTAELRIASALTECAVPTTLNAVSL